MASGIGVIVKQIRIAEPITLKKIELCEALVRMVEQVAGMDHPHLVRYLEASYNIETQFFEVITEQLPITFEENYINDEYHTKMHMLDVLETIRFLEDRGLAYLNLKPSNILFDHSGTIKLRDFVGNHIIETLISNHEFLEHKNNRKTDTEVDIKSFMNLIRYIGVYKIKFSNTSSYNRFIFYLENLHRWNFTRLKSDKFFQEMKLSDSPINISFKGFIRKVTLLKNSNDDPLFLTAEKNENVYKGDPKKKLQQERLFNAREEERESELFLKNLQRLQAFKKAKVVGSKPSHSSIHRSGVSIENLDTNNQKTSHIQKLKTVQKQLEEDFGASSDSELCPNPDKKLKNSDNFERYDSNEDRYIPTPISKASNLEDLRQKIKLLEQNFNDWGEDSNDSSDHIHIQDAQEINENSVKEDLKTERLYNLTPKTVKNEKRLLDMDFTKTQHNNMFKAKNSDIVSTDDIEQNNPDPFYIDAESEYLSNHNTTSLRRVKTSNLNNSSSIEAFRKTYLEKSRSIIDDKNSVKIHNEQVVSAQTINIELSNAKLCGSRVQTEATRGTNTNIKDEAGLEGRFKRNKGKLNLSTLSYNMDDSGEVGWEVDRGRYDIAKDLQKRRKRDSSLRQSLNF